ncbi:MAG: PAS domain-containing protein, partial [Chloroflexota bacterium]
MDKSQSQNQNRVWWSYLVEPRANIQSPQRRLRMRLLAILLVILTPMVMFSAASGVGPQPEDGFSLWLMALLLMAAYALTRTVHYLPAAILTISAVTIEPFVMITFSTNFDPGFVIFTSLFLLVGITLGSIMLPFAGLIFLISIDIVGLLLLPLIVAEITYFTIANGLLLIVVVSSLITIAARVRNQDLHYIEKQAEEIRENEARIQSLLDATFEGIVIQNDGVIEDINPAFQTLFGHTPAEAIGKPLSQFIAPVSQQRFADQLSQVQKVEEQVQQLEVKGLRQDGSIFDVG